MTGERDLAVLLRGMRPVLHDARYGYGLVTGAVPAAIAAFALIAEEEGTTVVALEAELIAQGVAFLPGWARISLHIHSDLAAVGLTAAIAAALTQAGISANVVAGYFHDHVFVPWERRAQALAVLQGLGDV